MTIPAPPPDGAAERLPTLPPGVLTSLEALVRTWASMSQQQKTTVLRSLTALAEHSATRRVPGLMEVVEATHELGVNVELTAWEFTQPVKEARRG